MTGGPGPTRARRPRGVLGGLAVLVAAGVLAGCGTAAGGGTASASGPSPAGATPSTAQEVDAVAPVASATPGACPRGWGSAARTGTSTAAAPLVRVAAGTHPCFDRLVLEFTGRVNGYDVRYVARVLEDASGRPVPVAGGARLKVTVVAPAYDGSRVTYRPSDPAHVAPVAGYPVFRQVAWAGSFEGSTTLALGVRAQLPFRVSVLPGPGTHSRLVIDVARRW
jgi:hypothetical protein